RVRWRGVDSPPRARVRAGALQFAVLGALTVLAVYAVSGLIGRFVFAAGHPESGGVWAMTGDSAIGVLHDWSFVLWIVAFVAALCARPRWAQAVAAIPVASGMVTAFRFGWQVEVWAAALVSVALLVAMTGLESRREAPNRRWWVV